LQWSVLHEVCASDLAYSVLDFFHSHVLPTQLTEVFKIYWNFHIQVCATKGRSGLVVLWSYTCLLLPQFLNLRWFVSSQLTKRLIFGNGGSSLYDIEHINLILSNCAGHWLLGQNLVKARWSMIAS
jgi:hypothetical protein